MSFPYREHDFEWKVDVKDRWRDKLSLHLRIWMEGKDNEGRILFKYLCEGRTGKDGKELPDYNPSDLRYHEIEHRLETKHPGGRWVKMKIDQRDAFVKLYNYFIKADQILLEIEDE